jgi:hypothetical protein
LLDDTVERVNITLPRRVLKRFDALASAAGESRSGYIAHLTLEEPSRVALPMAQAHRGSSRPKAAIGAHNSLRRPYRFMRDAGVAEVRPHCG